MKTILIVDDEKRVVDIYKKLLKKNGYKVLTSLNVVKAFDMLEEGKKVDLILLDINMPGIDGSTLYKVTKMLHSQVKVIVSSVYSVEEQKRRISGATDYFDKSEGNKVLLEKIKKVL